MDPQDLVLATRKALLLDDTAVSADLNLPLVHVADGRTAGIAFTDLVAGRFEVRPCVDREHILYKSVNAVVEAGWRIYSQQPAMPVKYPEIEIYPDPDLFIRAHLGREIPCSISLSLVNCNSADARLSVNLLLAPMVTVRLRFRFDPQVKLTGSECVDPAIIDIAARWVRHNRDVLRAICGGEHDLARDMLDIDLEDGNLRKAAGGLHTWGPEELIVADGVARNKVGKRMTIGDLDLAELADALRQESQRQAIIKAHRKRYMLGVVKGLPSIVY